MTLRRTRVVVAPDAFKGSCTAFEAADAIARGLRLASTAEVVCLPMADGGEGTLDVLAESLGLRRIRVDTVDAAGRPRSAQIGVSADGRTAVVESAQANGLPHVADLEADAIGRHTAGVGLLLQAALATGAEEIVVAIGGSATSDGGTGCLTALGAVFLDRHGVPVRSGAGGLAGIDRIDLAGLDPRWSDVVVRVAADVTNPLLGREGTAAVFAPQKGASAAEVATIDAGLEVLAEAIEATTGRRVGDLAGSGAAGGLAAGLHGLLGARIESGAELVAEVTGLRHALLGADLVISGEGSFDRQSLHGKVVSMVAHSAQGQCPVVVLAGRVDATPEECWTAGIIAALSIVPGPQALGDSIRDVREQLTRTAAAVGAMMLGPRPEAPSAQAFLRPNSR